MSKFDILSNLNNINLDDLKSEDSIGIKEVNNNDIAIIGMQCRFPMAQDINEYWDVIQNSIDCVTDLPKERKKDLDDYHSYIEEDKELKYIQASYLDDLDKFDYKFFKITPKEASLMNPIQRIFLETTWKAIEDAGYSEKKISGSNTGVYVGYIGDLEGYKYKEMVKKVNPKLLPLSMAGNLSSILPSRISYILNLKGPSILIDGACSSSLVAVHVACQALRNNECDMAIAGAMKTNIVPIDDEDYKIGIESSDGITRTFDDAADGSGVGEGAVAIVLKPYNKAKKDGDNIYAVIKGSAVNQDGSSMGITVPNPSAQSQVIMKAWEESRVNPETINYIEVHGTATRLGDSIEVQGLTDAFNKYTKKKQFCAVSSIKSNMGHLYDCAGLAGLVKATLALKNKKIPPSINFKKPNHEIVFEDSPIFVNTKLREWQSKDVPRRCGVSSFGISGSNCHIVLEEDTTENNIDQNCEKRVFTVSAKSKSSLTRLIVKYREFLEKSDDSLINICYTSNVGRSDYKYRVAIITDSLNELKARLDELLQCGLEESNNTSYFIGACDDFKYKYLNKSNKIHSDETRIKELSDICKDYVNGANIDWEPLYKNSKVKTISLPGYQFEKSRCWLDTDISKKVTKDKEELFYKTTWKELNGSLNENKLENCSEILFIGLDSNIKENIHNKLLTMNKKVIVAELDDDFNKVILENNITKVIFITKKEEVDEITSLDNLVTSQYKIINDILRLIKAIDSNSKDKCVEIFVVTDNVNEVTGEEVKVNYKYSTLIGFIKSVNKEFENIKCKCIDIDNHTDVYEIINELQIKDKVNEVAIRNHKIYAQEFGKVDIDDLEENQVNIKDNGVYVITGGLGGIGIEIAKSISANNIVKIVMFNRSKLPERSEWKDILSKKEDKDLCNKISTIQSIEEKGSKVQCYQADICKFDAVNDVLEDVRRQFKKIDGVIHCAGIGYNKEILQTTEEDIKKVLSAKVYGSYVMDKATEKDSLDFFIVCSSVASIFYSAGQSLYVAANSFLDSFSEYRNKKGKRTLSINWTTWKDTGMSARFGVIFDGIFKTMSASKAIEGFNSVLNKNINRVLIGELNDSDSGMYLLSNVSISLSDEIKEKIEKFKAIKKKKNEQVKNTDSSKEVILVGKEGLEYTEIEKKIADVCREVLGFEEINIYDSFFELGADSIMLKKMYVELEKIFPNTFEIADLFEYSSISRLSDFINSKSIEEEESNVLIEKNVDDDISDIFNQIENGNLTLEQAIDNLENI